MKKSATSWTKRSPLRYPGGKSRAIDVIRAYFPKGVTELLSPFLGGGSIELTLAQEGVRVHGYDSFAPLVDFWQQLLAQPDELADLVEAYFPLEKSAFYELQKQQQNLPTAIERGAAFYVLNRASFSGSTLSGGMSPQHPRFTQSSIDRIRHFRNPNLTVHCADFKASLQQHPHLFAYLDPPYLIKNALYGKKGNTHRGFDHEGLAEILTKRRNWILSYNDSEEIRDFYRNFEIVTPEWKYGMSKNKKSKEVLVLGM